MKFNLQLKTELSRYEKIVATHCCSEAAPICEPAEKLQPPKLRYRPSEKVVAGEILWKPIDRQAAMLLAKAPWWAQPPIAAPVSIVEQPKLTKPKKAKRKMKTEQQMPQPLAGHNKTDLIQVINGVEYFNFDVCAQKIIAEINRQPQELTALARAAIDARAVLHENVEKLGGVMEDFTARTKIALESLRQTRYAYVTETSQMLTPLKEVRQFFLGHDYENQISRLKAFVELCERLQKLKDSGFLDSVADTMLRLDEREGRGG